MIASNQLSMYRAITDLCDEVPKRIRAPGKPAAPKHLEKMEITNGLSIAENSTSEQQWGKRRARIRAKIRALFGRPEVIQIVF